MRKSFPSPNRRHFLMGSGLTALLGRLSPLSGRASDRTSQTAEENIYTSIGVRPVINALGTATRLGGSLMPPEVVKAMNDAGRYFVPLPELIDKSGEWIARLIGIEAALVTSGAAGAITLGTAACVTGTDQSKIHRLPDTSGMKNEVIIQKGHCCGYMAQVRLVGARTIEVESREDLEKAIGPKTAMLFFVNTLERQGEVGSEEWVAMGKRFGVPTFNDAAADLPPKGRLSEYVKMGFDLVTFSGGKGLRGPQCSGLLLGRKDLVEAAKLNGSPFGGIGRGMKVGKEEIMGLLTAVEVFLKADHEAQRKEFSNRVKEIAEVLAEVKGVQTRTFVPEIANHVPHLAVEWDSQLIRLAPGDVVDALLSGDPSIEVAGSYMWGTHPAVKKEGITVSVWMLQPGEHQIVAQRLKEVLSV